MKGRQAQADTDVSIRSRLLGREILWHGRSLPGSIEFQSAPGFWAGRYLQQKYLCLLCRCFNPLPAFGPGDTALLQGFEDYIEIDG